MTRERIESVLNYITNNLKDRDVSEMSRKIGLSRPTLIKLKKGDCKNVTIETLLTVCDYIKKNYEV